MWNGVSYFSDISEVKRTMSSWFVPLACTQLVPTWPTTSAPASDIA